MESTFFQSSFSLNLFKILSSRCQLRENGTKKLEQLNKWGFRVLPKGAAVPQQILNRRSNALQNRAYYFKGCLWASISIRPDKINTPSIMPQKAPIPTVAIVTASCIKPIL
jgi:hypothetical protein